LEDATPRINQACKSLGFSEEEAEQLRDMLLSLKSEIPKALQAMEDLEPVVQEVKMGLLTSTSPDDLLDSLLSVIRIVVGNEVMQTYVEPYIDMLMTSFEESLASAGCSEETVSLYKPLVSKLAAFICNNGLKSFTLVWHDVAKFAFEESDGAEAALSCLESLLGRDGEDGEKKAKEDNEENDDGAFSVAVVTNDESTVEEEGFSAGLNEMQRVQAKEIFDRYDLDGSGTVNSLEEAKQMTTNLCFSFKYDVTPDEMKTILTTIKDVENSPLRFEEFWEWFSTNFAKEAHFTA